MSIANMDAYLQGLEPPVHDPDAYLNGTNVLPFTGKTRLDMPAQAVVDEAEKVQLKDIVVMGWTKEGKPYFCSSMADGADVLWLLEQIKLDLLLEGRE